MTRAYTSRSEIEQVIHPLCELLSDVSTLYRFPYSTSFMLTEDGIDIRSGHLRPDNGGLSNHKMLRVSAKLDETSSDEINQLKELIGHIPPFAAVRTVRIWVMMTQVATAVLEIDGFKLRSVLQSAPQNLTTQLYTFIRTHENFDMGDDLYPYMLAPESNEYPGPIWADTGANALLRYAAIYPELRASICRGKGYGCVRLGERAHPDTIAALTKKLHKTPALTVKERVIRRRELAGQ
jgi:hypothetical protein